MMKPTLEYDEEADALYITFSEGDVEETVTLSDLRMVDYAADGSLIGIEFLSPTHGVDLADVPESETVDRLLAESPYHFRILA